MSDSLNGMNILVTRAEHQAAELNDLIQQFGGRPINLPLQIVKQNPISIPKFKKLVEEAEWILFTSVNSVYYFVQNSTKELFELMYLKKIGAVGEKTKRMIEKHGLKVDFIPSQFTGKAFATELSKLVHNRSNFLFIRGSLASDTVPKILEQNGHHVSLLTIYETIPNLDQKGELIKLLLAKQIDVVTFLNPFSVKQFCYLIDKTISIKDLKKIKIACIGEVTALEARERGFENIIVPSKYTIESLIQKIADDVIK